MLYPAELRGQDPEWYLIPERLSQGIDPRASISDQRIQGIGPGRGSPHQSPSPVAGTTQWPPGFEPISVNSSIRAAESWRKTPWSLLVVVHAWLCFTPR